MLRVPYNEGQRAGRYPGSCFLMRLLWVKSDFLHPTTRGGQIRTLEMLRCLHRRHEVHYVCLDEGTNPEGPARANEYASAVYPVRHVAPPRRSLRFAGQLAAGLVSRLPVAVARYRSGAMRAQIEKLIQETHFDCIVCDFLFPAPNIPDLGQVVLFQHNVEAVIWKRHTEQAGNPAVRWYFRGQAERMETYEREVCRAVRGVVAVSEIDRDVMQQMYGIDLVRSVPTGVNCALFRKPEGAAPKLADIVFVGSMDWLPNIDGARFFLDEILPAIRREIPECTVALVGRRPDSGLEAAARRHTHVTVTGTVNDVRPWLWGAAVSVVPLRIGGGTRLKIFEAMAAGIPVVSTTIGAEGLPIKHGRHLVIEDAPERFAAACVDLLRNQARARELAGAALAHIEQNFSWEAVTHQFEEILHEYAGVRG